MLKLQIDVVVYHGDFGRNKDKVGKLLLKNVIADDEAYESTRAQKQLSKQKRQGVTP